MLCHSFLRACWAEEKDIADDGVIRDCLEQAGFNPNLADSGLLVGAETYAANLEEAVDRGVFAFKPSNGFLVRTREKAGNVWAPGLWWRLGRRVGVGGMTASAEAKFMSEILSAMVLQR